MVLKGGDKGLSIPFDAPLYDFNRERGIEYRNCEAITAVFLTSPDVQEILPEGLEPYGDPPIGAIWISRYSYSTVGTYNEHISTIMVKDMHGDMGYYIPYIYVTNDAAMAAGRELAGAPKKMADIRLETEYDYIQGVVERPSGKRLITCTFKPVERAGGSIVDAYLPYPLPLLSVRHVPWVKNKIGGLTHLTQLISWYAEVDLHVDPKGEKMVWSGPVSITYDSPSQTDPVHKLKIDEVIAALYFQFDMKLNVKEVQKEY
jgi:acetoacetate decarboxylase